MNAEIRILSGARAGQVVSLARQAVIGRQADSDLCFHPEQDLEVSGRHAVLVYDDGGWLVRDLDSRNGTFVNGHRIGETRLRDGDHITFGWQGPEVEIRFQQTGSDDTEATVPYQAGESTGVTRVIRENVRLKRTASVLALALAAVIASFVWISMRQRSDLALERQNLLQLVDEVLDSSGSAVRRLAGERHELGEALLQSQTEVRDVRNRLQDPGGSRDSSKLPDLRRELQTAIAALERQQLAAALDFESIQQASRPAVAVIWVETAEGEVRIGTGFAVRPDATIVTNRHLVMDTGGRPPRRMAAQFSDSDQVFPARLVNVSSDADLAVIKVDNIIGEVPTVHGLNTRSDTVRAGVAIAWIGFPLGGETWPQDSQTGRVARPLGAVGVIVNASPDEFEIQGYGAAGVSGSPVFDARGEVVAVLYGGRRGDAGQTLYAIPIRKVERLLGGLQR